MMNTGIWDERSFRELKRDEKLLFLYLLGNRHISYYGVMEAPSQMIAADLDMPVESIEAMLELFEGMDLVFRHPPYWLVTKYFPKQQSGTDDHGNKKLPQLNLRTEGVLRKNRHQMPQPVWAEVLKIWHLDEDQLLDGPSNGALDGGYDGPSNGASDGGSVNKEYRKENREETTSTEAVDGDDVSPSEVGKQTTLSNVTQILANEFARHTTGRREFLFSGKNFKESKPYIDFQTAAEALLIHWPTLSGYNPEQIRIVCDEYVGMVEEWGDEKEFDKLAPGHLSNAYIRDTAWPAKVGQAVERINARLKEAN